MNVLLPQEAIPHRMDRCADVEREDVEQHIDKDVIVAIAGVEEDRDWLNI